MGILMPFITSVLGNCNVCVRKFQRSYRDNNLCLILCTLDFLTANLILGWYANYILNLKCLTHIQHQIKNARVGNYWIFNAFSMVLWKDHEAHIMVYLRPKCYCFYTRNILLWTKSNWAQVNTAYYESSIYYMSNDNCMSC